MARRRKHTHLGACRVLGAHIINFAREHVGEGRPSAGEMKTRGAAGRGEGGSTRDLVGDGYARTGEEEARNNAGGHATGRESGEGCTGMRGGALIQTANGVLRHANESWRGKASAGHGGGKHTGGGEREARWRTLAAHCSNGVQERWGNPKPS